MKARASDNRDNMGPFRIPLWAFLIAMLCWHAGGWDGSEAGASESRDDADSGSGAGGHTGVFAVVRCSGVGLVGERGTGVPNASIAEISIEMDFSMSITLEYAE